MFISISFQHGELSLCAIADCISNDADYDLSDHAEPAKILDILNTVGNSKYTMADFLGKNERQQDIMIKDMQKLILGYVRNNCGCVLWKDGLKPSKTQIGWLQIA